MTYKPCPRCKRLIPQGLQYCPDCRPIAEAQAAEAMERKAAYRRAKYNKAYNARRDPKYPAFYRTKEWRTLSRAKLQAASYKCEAKLEGCKGIAVEVHHIKPIQTNEGWDERLEWANLEALCTACHNARHGGRFKNKMRQSDVLDIRDVMRELEENDKTSHDTRIP